MNPRLKAVLSHAIRVLSGNDLRDETDANLLDRAIGHVRCRPSNYSIQYENQFSSEDYKIFQDEISKFLKERQK